MATAEELHIDDIVFAELYRATYTLHHTGSFTSTFEGIDAARMILEQGGRKVYALGQLPIMVSIEEKSLCIDVVGERAKRLADRFLIEMKRLDNEAVYGLQLPMRNQKQGFVNFREKAWQFAIMDVDVGISLHVPGGKSPGTSFLLSETDEDFVPSWHRP